MKKTKILIIIAAIVIVAVIATVIILKLSNKNQNIEETPKSTTAEQIASDIHRNNPDVDEEEILNILNTPLTDEQKKNFEQLLLEEKQAKEEQEKLAEQPIKGIPIEDIKEPINIDDIPDNMILKMNEDGELYLERIYPDGFDSLESYEKYLQEQADEQKRQAEEALKIRQENTDNSSDTSTPSNNNITDGVYDDRGNFYPGGYRDENGVLRDFRGAPISEDNGVRSGDLQDGTEGHDYSGIIGA